MERWLPVPGWEGLYEVSDRGQVKSLPRQTYSGVRGGKVLKPREHRNKKTGRLQHVYVVFTAPGHRQMTYSVHKLVMLTFKGPRSDGMQTRHLNGNPADNRYPENLVYGTPKENIEDRDKQHRTNHQMNKTHCPQGHPYSEENTYWYGNSRQCKTCRNGARPVLKCSESDCENSAKTRRLCAKHYAQWLRAQRTEEQREKIRARDREYARWKRKNPIIPT